MKGVLLAKCPSARVVDVTHEVPPQDLLAASITLEGVLRVFPKGTIHVAVVDPGVGTKRRLLLAEVNRQYVLCPDNGLITWPWRRLGGIAHELNVRTNDVSATFHGRDILAPAAAELACGKGRGLRGTTVEPVLLGVRPAEAGAQQGVVIYIDRFGNALSNVPGEVELRAMRVGRKTIAARRTYGDVDVGEAVVLIGSSGLWEVAVRNGSAAEVLGIKVGMRLRIN